jgi:hypothetical protein
VPPLFQHHLDLQKFPISYVIVSLSWVAKMGQEGMQLLVLGRPLGQDCPHSDARSINLNPELTGRNRMDDDGGCSKLMLNIQNALATAGDHVNNTLGEVKEERGATRVL